MKLFAKLKTLVLSFVLSTTLLFSGCSSNDQTEETSNLDPKNPVVITLWHYYAGDNKTAITNLIDNFNQTVGLEKGVIVQPVAKGSVSDLETELTDSSKGVINSEEMPDIFSCYQDKAVEIDALDKICDLTTYLTEEEKNSYVEEFLNYGFTTDGRLLSIPIVKSTELLFLNQTSIDDFVAATGYDQSMISTWEGCFEFSKAYYEWIDAKTPEIAGDGKGFLGIDALANYIIVSGKQLGTEIIDGDLGLVHLNKNALQQIFDIYFQAMSCGYFNSVGAFCSDDVKSGELAAYVGSTSGALYFPTWIEENNAEKNIEMSAILQPYFENGEHYAVQQGAGMSVSKSTPEREEASILFLTWFTQTQQNVSFAMSTGYLPVTEEAYTSDLFDEKVTEMKSLDQAVQNVATIYEISSKQILESKTYSSKAFVGSYGVRSLLEESLTEISTSGKETVQELRALGMSEEDILNELKSGEYFEEWITTIKEKLDYLEITYIEE